MKNDKFNKNLNEKLMEIFLVIKGIAILSVIIAHIFPDDLNINFLEKQTVLYFFQKLSVIGVPCFLFISGYHFCMNNDTFINFFKKRLSSIYLPWLFCSTFIFLLGGLSGYKSRMWDLLDYLQYVIGIGTIYYYMTALTFLFLIFWGIKKINLNPRIVMGITFILSLTTAYLYSSHLDIMRHYGYLNPLTWIFFFAFGYYLAGQQALMDSILRLGRIKYCYSLMLFVIILVLAYYDYFLPHFAYFSILSFIIESFFIIFLVLIVDSKWVLLKFLGQYSFTIYLMHLPFASVTLSLFRKAGMLYFPLNLLSMISSITAILGLIWILQKLRLNKTLKLIGVRNFSL